MASAHQVRGRSRNRSAEHTTTSVISTPKPGTKRLFSNRESRQLARSENAELTTEPAADGGDGERHSDKRHRSSDWPLPNTNTNPSPSSISSTRHAPSRKTPQSPSSSSNRSRVRSRVRSRARSLVRPSKFVEGSMNDRVSQMPPVPYLEPDDEFLTEHNNAGCDEGGRGRKLTRSRKFAHHPNTSVAESSANRSNAPRSSSLFRFGKSIAASFNPNNWKFWGKEHEEGQVGEEEEDEEAVQTRVLKERREKAERIYQELKESGHFRDSAVRPRLFAPASERKAGKHDSGIEFGEMDVASSVRGSMSIEEKRNGRVFLEPPSQSRYSQRGVSPASGYEGSIAHSSTSSPKKFNFKKPSLANMKSAFAGDSSLNVNDQHQAHRIPSRKDLHKQQKLVRRVSNLEERLKQARQQLQVALNEPLPSTSASASDTPTSQAPSRVSRHRFVPGALSSLPSERLLSGYVSSEAEDGEMSGIGQAVSTDLEMRKMRYMSGGLEGHGKNDRAATASLYSQEVRQDDDTVMESVEDEKPARFETTASIKATSYITLTNPKDTELPLPDYEDEEPTPKVATNKPSALSQSAEPTKKRKSIFERIPDDGGAYDPSDDEEENEDDDLESDIISDISSLTKPKTKAKSTSTAPSKASISRSKGPTLLLHHPRKLQKVVPGPKNTKADVAKSSSAKSSVSGSSTMPPPTRTAPPPPPSASTVSKPKTLHKPNTQKKSSRAPPAPSNRQQSASPPPSSATFSGPELKYTKPTRTHVLTPYKASSTAGSGASSESRMTDERDKEEDDEEEYEDEEDGDAIPPLPPMPKTVRLASGEVIRIEGMVKPLNGKGKGKKVAGKSESESSGDRGGEKEGDGQEGKRAGMSASMSKQSFEWPDDVF